MPFGDVAPGVADGGFQHHVGQQRDLVGQGFERPHAGNVLRHQPELLRVLEVAQGVHQVFHVAVGIGQLAVELLAQGRPVRLGIQHPCVQQLVQQDRMPGQVVGDPRAGRAQRSHPPQGLRVFRQQGEIARAAADGLHQPEDAHQRFVRIAMRRGHFDQGRNQAVKAVAVFRRKLLVTLRVAHGGQLAGGVVGSVIAESGQLSGGLGSIDALPQAEQRVFGMVFGRQEKHLLEVPVDRGADPVEPGQKAVPVGKTHAGGNAGLELGLVRQGLRLLVVEVLDAVLKVA